MEARNLPRIETHIGTERDDDEVQEFAEAATTLIESHIEANREEATAFKDVKKSVDEVLANHNMRSLEIRDRHLENPKVTLWLKDCPVWANDSWRETFHPWGLNYYNGKVTVTFDVRPF